MDINRLTERAREAVLDAEKIATRYGPMEVDGEHLLLALLSQPEGLAPRLLRKMNVDPDLMVKRVEDELGKRPRVSGPGAEAGKVYITPRLNQIFLRADDEAK